MSSEPRPDSSASALAPQPSRSVRSEPPPGARSGWLDGLRALRRDWRAGELRLLLLALAVAVAAVSSVGFLADRVGRALDRDAAQMLGGDLALQSGEPLPAEFLAQAEALGLSHADTLQFPSMAGSASGMQLVSLKAVSERYPLRGQLRLGGGETAGAPPAGGVWVDPALLTMLSLSVGDRIEVGRAELTVAGTIVTEPDRGMQFVNSAPRLMMRLDELVATGLLTTGSRVQYHLLLAGPGPAVDAYRTWAQPRLAQGQRLNDLEESRPQAHRGLQRAHQFLQLVALLTVMIAAVAVALGARRYTQRHETGMAVMRCLGARRRQLSQSLAAEFLALGVLAGAAGLLVGYATHLALAGVVAGWYDTGLPPPGWRAAGQGMVCGLLLLLGFAYPPLAGLTRVAPVRVLRQEADSPAVPAWRRYGPGALALAALVLWVAGDPKLGATAAGGMALAFLLFALLARAMVFLLDRARRLANLPAGLRFALAGMSRHRSLTVAQTCALAMGLTTLLLLGLTRNDLMQSWRAALPADAPNSFLVNIQPDQREAVSRQLADAGVGRAVLWPMVRGRLVAINGKAVQVDDYTEDRARRMVDREFNLSHATALPAGNRLVQGRWLDPAGHEVALETGLAKTLGVTLGDRLGFDVAGQVIDVTVVGLREVKWDSFEVNFFALLSPAALAQAPASYLTSFHLADPSAAPLQPLLRGFPNLTHFDVGQMLAQLREVLDQVSQAVQLLFFFSVAAGAIVLGAALFATRDERAHEAAILRALGASSRQLAWALRLELALVGLLAGLLSASAAVGTAWLLARFVFEFPLALSWWPWLAGAGLGIASALVAGHYALSGVLRTPPLSTLRALA